MRIGYLDCFSGVAGDMWVGALLDAGLDIADLQSAVASLELPGVTVRAQQVTRCSLAGIRFVVERDGVEIGRAPIELPASAGVGETAVQQLRPMTPGALAPKTAASAHSHRRLADIVEILERAALPDTVAKNCLRTFEAIAEVEARAHATTIEEVHFHEVGAEDTIVDIVCACLGTELIGIERLYSSAVTVGTGTVRAAHGVLPVPAPATLELLFGVPVRQGVLTGERTTPTGAALLKTLVHEFEPTFTWLPGVRGYGAGTKDDGKVPNLLRLAIGELRDPGSAAELLELSCQLDTATGEQLGWLLDEALRRGATDVFATPVHMKKGRPGHLLTVLCEASRGDDLVTWLLEESSSLGVRQHAVSRAVLERWQQTRSTEFGPVQFKVARLPSGVEAARPEDDEVRRLCAEHGLSRAELLRRLQD
ncbi:MAG: nickel pincer cofactor biosynthesis protein LarC [Planctomycetota bacterium]|nr:nickel pincer cofactor biosynthesis protein LarC [Planctomycetota bacterium]